MKKSIGIEAMFSGGDFYGSFAKVRAAGFDYLEFGDWTGLDLTLVKELLREFRLSVSAIGGTRGHSLGIPEERGEFLEHLSQSIAVAKDLGCGHLILQSDAGAGRRAASDFTRVAAATRALLDAAPRAERAGTTLLLKPLGTRRDPASGLHTTPSAGDIVRVVNSPAIRLLYDVTQMQAMEGDIVRTLRKYRDLVGYVHIGGALDCPESCEVDLRVVRRVLAEELGYDGFVGFEFRPMGEAAACLEMAKAF